MTTMLEDICTELQIKTRSSKEYLERYRGCYPPRERMLTSMAQLDWLLGNNVMLIGGLSVVPELRGYRQMRRTSNDLDLVTHERGVYRLRELFGNSLFRSSEHGDICFDFDGVPCSVDVGETHGWQIPFDVWETSTNFPYGDKQIRTIAAEYLIMMKLRRTLKNKHIYGKDKLDIAGLLLAPFFKRADPVNLRKTARLIRDNVSDNCDLLDPWMQELGKIIPYLQKQEQRLFGETCEQLITALCNP